MFIQLYIGMKIHLRVCVYARMRACVFACEIRLYLKARYNRISSLRWEKRVEFTLIPMMCECTEYTCQALASNRT